MRGLSLEFDSDTQITISTRDPEATSWELLMLSLSVFP